MYCFVLHILIYLYCTNSKEKHSLIFTFNMHLANQVEYLVVFAFESKHRTCASLCYVYNIDILFTKVLAPPENVANTAVQNY